MLIECIPVLALLVEPAEISAEVATAEVTPTAPADTHWITREKPRVHDVTLGVFAGPAFLGRDIDLFQRSSRFPRPEYDGTSAEVGIRLGYFPSRFFALEGELAALPTRYGGAQVFAYSARAHGLLQLGFWRVVPFVLLGGGVLGVSSDRSRAGHDADPALHVGGGVKVHVLRQLVVRLDVRDTLSARRGGSDAPTNTVSLLFSLEWRFGAAPKPAPLTPFEPVVVEAPCIEPPVAPTDLAIPPTPEVPPDVVAPPEPEVPPSLETPPPSDMPEPEGKLEGSVGPQ